MDRQQCVLVLGATGYAGRFLVQRFHDAGYRIRAVVRDRQRALAPGPYDAPALDGLVDDWVVTRDAFDVSIMTEVDHVVSALGVTRQKSDPWTVDFALNLHYLQLAEQHDVKSFLYIGVMHADEGTSTVSRAKHAFMEILSRSPLRSQIINPSAYFSDLTEVFKLAGRGIAFGLGAGAVRLSPIHGADLADFCLTKFSEDTGTWDVGGPEVLTYRQVVHLAFDAAGRKQRYIRIPHAVTNSAIWLTDRVSPRAASLTRFFLEGLQSDSVGIAYGQRTLAEYYASLS